MEHQTEHGYDVMTQEGSVPVKMWTRGVPVEDGARRQLLRAAQMPFIFKHVAVMPDVHIGIGATVGSVIPTKNAIIPAAVGVDIGCGMMACRTTLKATDLPDSLGHLRSAIERAVPHGRTASRRGRDKGSWGEAPKTSEAAWSKLVDRFDVITGKHKVIRNSNNLKHLGTLGTGNHFIEVCLDQEDRVWFMLHSGSRGVGNRIGRYFIELAKKDMEKWFINIPDKDLAYFPEGTDHFDDYVESVEWAQDFAFANRTVMMQNVIAAARAVLPVPFDAEVEAVNCHHNYVSRENHFGENIFVTRKGAVRARKGDMGIIPGSMGTQSYIVRGLGNEESFCSCSHGECRKDAAVIDETPAAYKPIDEVMEAQKDLVEIVHTLRQVVCVKG